MRKYQNTDNHYHKQKARSAARMLSRLNTDIFRCLDLSSDWFTIYYGDNVFSYTSDTGVDNLQFTIMNDVIYEGI